jgi:hypothetical protein
MNIFRLALELFVIYLLYKLVFDFIIPVYRTTKVMKGKMNEMHRAVNEQQQAQQTQQQPTAKPVEKQSVSGDYIDYEEVK